MIRRQFIQKARKVHGSKYGYGQIRYRGIFEQITIVCKEHGTFSQRAHDHLNGNGCPKCGCLKNAQKRTKSLKAFIADARRVHGQRYDYSRVIYKHNRFKVIIVCAKHGAFRQQPKDHLKGKGCAQCGFEKRTEVHRLDPQVFVKRIEHSNSNIKVTGMPTGCQNKVSLLCKVCGHQWKAVVGSLATASGKPLRGCPRCRESRGEKAVASFLSDAGLQFERQKRFESCRSLLPLPFDFCVSDAQVLIEFQGKQHFHLVKTWGGIKALHKVQKHDAIKRKWASQNGFDLIEVKYTDNVEEFLSTRLLLKKAA